MGRWEKVRWVLRALAAVTGAVAVAPATANHTPTSAAVAYITGLVCVGAGALSVNLPRDRWSRERRARKLGQPPKTPGPFDDESPTPGIGPRRQRK